MFSKLLLAFSLIATLLHLSSCVGTIAVATSSKKQTVTFQLPNEKSKLYVNDSFYGQGATLKIKIPKTLNTKLRIETEGYRTLHDILPLAKRNSKRYLTLLDIPLLIGVIRAPLDPDFAIAAIIWGVPASGLVMPLDFLIAASHSRGSKYLPKKRVEKIYPNLQKQQDQKSLSVESIVFAVPKEKNILKFGSVHAYFKKSKKAAKKIRTIPNVSSGITGESEKVADALNKELLKSGFIDSTKTSILKSKTNGIYVRGEITEFEQIYLPSYSGEEYFYYKLHCKWIVKDAYDNIKKEISIKSNSVFFISPNDSIITRTFQPLNHSAVDIIRFEALADGMKNNLYELFENQEFKALLKTENANENANTVVQNISRPTQKPQSFEDAMQACATILVEKNKEKGHGSGFFISTDGYLITNYHVVVGMDKITVKTNDGKTHSAKVLRFDFENDLALLKIEATSPFAFEIPADKNYKIGIDVFTIGTPSYESLGQTLSKGILSGARTSEVGNEVLQTDVSVNPGNSGGPLLNKEFQLIGVVNSKLMGRGVEGIAFGSAAKDLLKQLNLAY